MRRRGWCGALALVVLTLGAAAGEAADVRETFTKGTKIVGLSVGGGGEVFERGGETADLRFLYLNLRLAILPFDPIGARWYAGALEAGLEGWVQPYLEPSAVAGGLKLFGRYNLIGLPYVVPYVEGAVGAGGLSLEVLGYRSPFTFVLEGGGGLSTLVTPNLALSVGYRFQHLSNWGIYPPDRELEAHTGYVGVSYFFR